MNGHTEAAYRCYNERLYVYEMFHLVHMNGEVKTNENYYL